MNGSLLSLRRALELAGGISDSTRRRIQDFPRAVVLSRTKRGHACRIAFVESEVRAWVQNKIAEARAESKPTPAPSMSAERLARLRANAAHAREVRLQRRAANKASTPPEAA